MKRILQNLDKASARVVGGANDMRQFLKVVTEKTATPQDREVAKAKADEKGFPFLNVKVLPMPQQAGDGEKLETLPNGNIRYISSEGVYVYDKTGKPLSWNSANIMGLSQTTDLVSGNITVRYAVGPIDVSMVYDKNGKSLDQTKIQYATGVGTLGAERNKGITTKSFTPAKGATGDELGAFSTKDLYAMGNQSKADTYDRAMAQVNKPTESQYMSENTLRKYLDIIERMPLPKIGADGQPDPADMEKLQTAMDQKQKISQQLSAQAQGIRPAQDKTPPTAGKIDYTKEGPKTKSSQGVELEYGIPVKNNKFMNPQKLPNWDAHGDDEQFEILQAYKAWLRDYTSRWPEAQQQPDGTWRPTKPGLAPMTPKFENANFKDYLQMVEEGFEGISEEKRRLDPRCWKNKKIGDPKTKMKGGVRVNNCVPKE